MADYLDRILKDLNTILLKKGVTPKLDSIKVSNYIKKISRTVDPKVIEEIMNYLGPCVLKIVTNGNLKFSLVIDANIIISDAFRVASNKPSTTDRIFSSPFLDLIAPTVIVSEVNKQIKSDLPKNASLSLALAWAKKLLSKVKLVNSQDIIYKCNKGNLKQFEAKYGNDVYYLCLAMHSRSNGIISMDKKAFNHSNTSIKRFQLNDVVKLVVSQESGILVLSGISIGIYSISQLTYWILYILYSTILELLKYISNFLVLGILGINKLLEITPAWVWYIIAGFFISTGILFIFSKWFRNSVVSKGSEFYEKIFTALKGLRIELVNSLNKLKCVINVYSEELGPYLEPLIFGLILTIKDMRRSYR